MKKILKNLSMEFIVGLFFISAMIILGLSSIILNQDLIKKDNQFYTIKFSEVGGLANGDRVLIQGVEVGRVKAINLADEDVFVKISIKPEIKIFPNYKIKIGSSSLLGGRNILINNGNASSGDALSTSLTLTGNAPFDILEEIGGLTTSIRDQKIIENLGVAGENIKNISEKIKNGEGTLGALLSKDDFIIEAQTTIKNIKNISEKIKNGEGTIGKLITDESFYTDLKSTIANINQGSQEITLIAKDLREGKGSLGKFLTDDTFYTNFTETGINLSKITKQIASGEGTIGKFIFDNGEAYKDLSQIFASLKESSLNLSQGQGTLGKLINNSELYDEINLGIKEFRRTIEDAREQSIWSSFGSFIFGAF